MNVAIVGYTPSRALAPFNDSDWEIWALNDLYKHIPKYDRWFQLHDFETINQHALENKGRTNAKDQFEAFKKMSCPVYLQEKHPEIPMSETYPLDKILKKFGKMFQDPDEVKYFTNSISYMIALAIYEGAKKIHVYGVDMAVGTEFHEQRASCEFWLGVAAGMGIEIHVPKEADLLKSRFMYGYDDKKVSAFSAKMNQIAKELKTKVENEERLENAAHDRKLQYMGAQLAHKEILRNWE